ncbi:MAG: hypothetical protein H0T42_29565 [Deltaproteobacteria bacterium]|nr:hypothetical protein [Deltaproteobacteria bacterium]
MTTSGEDRVSATAVSRMNFANQHLMTAREAALRVHEVEKANTGWGPFFEQIIQDTSTAVMLSVAALEAYLGELRFDPGAHFPGHSTKFAQRCLDLVERSPILERVQFYVLMRGNTPNMGKRPGQSMPVLIELRNELTHFEPAWHEPKNRHAKLSATLGGFVERTPFLDASDAVFPRQWMSYSVAKWAVESVKDFVIELAEQNDWPCGYQKLSERFALPRSPTSGDAS